MSKTKHPEEIYTKPELRDKIKDELMADDKGGKSGEWSARKSQMLVKKYEAQGGGYLNDEKTEKQKAWKNERTKTGKPPMAKSPFAATTRPSVICPAPRGTN